MPRTRLRSIRYAIVIAVCGCGPILGLDGDARLLETGEPQACGEAADCDDTNLCTDDTCVDGTCAYAVITTGLATTQILGDCTSVACSDGKPEFLPDDNDAPATTACASYTCEDGDSLMHPNELGTSCSTGGVVCDGDGACVGCLEDTHCSYPDTCAGAGIEQECGCTALSCVELGRTCGIVSDTCYDMIDCNDGAVSGDESDVDCGGDQSTCSRRCVLGQVCAQGRDCDTAFCAGGTCADAWSSGYGSTGPQHVSAVGVSPDGSIVLVGTYENTINFGGGELPTMMGEAMFIAKLDPLGGHMFASSYIGGTPKDVAVDKSGNIVVVGEFAGALDFGPGSAMQTTLQRAFVVKLDSAGKLLWQTPLGGDAQSTSSAATVAVDGAGDVVVAGGFTGNLTIEDETFVELGGSDIFLVKLNTAGGKVFARAFGDTTTERAHDVAASGDSIALTGDFSSTIDFGSGAIDTKGGWDVYVARFDGSGVANDATSIGGIGPQTAGGVAFDGIDLVVAGSFSDTAEVDTEALVSTGGYDVFVTKLDDSFKPVWVESFGDAEDQYVAAVSADPFGGVVVAGTFSGTMVWGPSLLVSLGGFDVFLTKLDIDGGVLFSRAYGDTQADTLRDVAVSDFGTIVATGEFRGTINLGQGTIQSFGSDDIFLAALAP